MRRKVFYGLVIVVAIWVIALFISKVIFNPLTPMGTVICETPIFQYYPEEWSCDKAKSKQVVFDNDIRTSVRYKYEDLPVIDTEQLPEDVQAVIAHYEDIEPKILNIYAASVKYFGDDIVFTDSKRYPLHAYNGSFSIPFDINGKPHCFWYDSEYMYILD